MFIYKKYRNIYEHLAQNIYIILPYGDASPDRFSIILYDLRLMYYHDARNIELQKEIKKNLKHLIKQFKYYDKCIH
jgi:hypothetical protein